MKSIANWNLTKYHLFTAYFVIDVSFWNLAQNTVIALSFPGRKFKRILRQHLILWANEILWDFSLRPVPVHWWGHSLGTGLRDGFYGNLVVQRRLEDFTGQLQWEGMQLIQFNSGVMNAFGNAFCERFHQQLIHFVNALCVCNVMRLCDERQLTRRLGTSKCTADLCWMDKTSNGFWCIGIKGEMSGTVCVTFKWDIYIYMSCL